jgi:flagellar motor switch protein FliG
LILTLQTTLSQKRKAAMIVQMVVGNGDKLSLASLPLSLQQSLADELGDIRLVDKTTVSNVAAEFVKELEDVGLIAPGGAENVLKTLGDHISPDLASKLRADIANANMQDPWAMIAALGDEELIAIMKAQSVEIAAVVLSKLTVAKAANALSKLPGERARRITYAISQTADITPAAVKRIGAALVQEHCITTAVAFDKAPVQRVGAILNSSAAKTRDDMLEGLTAADTAFASDVREAIFTFADIPERLVPTDIAACIRGVSPETLNVAIGGALAMGGPLEVAAEFVLSNISQRMAGQIREEIEELGKIKPATGDAAMNEVTASIRELADAGTIKLIVAETEEDDA